MKRPAEIGNERHVVAGGGGYEHVDGTARAVEQQIRTIPPPGKVGEEKRGLRIPFREVLR